MFDAFLTVTDENVTDLHDLGIYCEVEDELYCQVDYDVNRADRNVGIMSDDVQVHKVYCGRVDVTSYFDDDALRQQILDALDNRPD